MSSSSKLVSGPHLAAARGHLYRVAIVGAATLKGREVAEMLNERNFPAVDVRLLDDDEALGKLEALGNEVTFIQSARPEKFEHVDFTFYVADSISTRKSWKHARDAGSAIVDLSGTLEDEPGATVRSLWIERERGQIAAPDLQPGPCVAAHPAAVTLALLVLRARKAGNIRRVIATIFEPASERGQKGMDELHQQTTNLLSFQPLPKDVFAAQVAFNMIGSYGRESPSSLPAVQATILRHYHKITGGDGTQPSILLLHAPVFHGYTLSVYLEMEQRVDREQFSQAMAGDHVTLTTPEDETPSNVSAAGQPDILVSATVDASQPNAVWLWAAADNLRIAAITAVDCAESMTATRPLGKIQ
jgi:aspartate-semialdehyde dehydrogenase